MKRFLQQLLIIIIATIIVVQPLLAVQKTRAEETEGEAGTDFAEETPEMMSRREPSNADDPGDTPANSGRQVDVLSAAAEQLELSASNTSTALAQSDETGEYISKINDLGIKSKLVFSPSDLQEIRILNCLGNVIPDYARHDDSLATATGRTIQEIETLRLTKPTEWKKLIEQAQEAERLKIVSRLRYDLPNFACIAGVDEAMAAEMLAYDQQSVDAIIKYAQEKVIIDRRVLMLLTNLVTPKDVGGSGHERIKIYRLRRGYDRDARIYSRESDAIREEQQQGQQNELSTIGDVAEADRSDLSENTEFDNAEAHAAVVSSTGTNEGDLIFNSTEDDANISAHSRGEAVDISEIDHVRCTLIQKRRIGGDKKTAQPPTPIKVAWQTSEGYDNSPPPDYSSLAMNLSQIASGQYLELLDELGIDPDSEENLADASFGDIVGLIGESLLAEILSSPTNSLSGYSLSDTAKKIGGMILADNLALPRAPFIEADLLDLEDLETKIGESYVEQKLRLKYGSLRGNNLAEVLENVGLRHVEKQLDIRSGTIRPGMSGPELKIAIGRSKIDDALRLKPGTFQADSTIGKLKEVAGERKINYVFSNPSEIDEILGIDFGYSLEYKNGTRSPDAYATLVGAKALADHAYIFTYASSSGMALGLDTNPVAGGSGQLPSTVNTNLAGPDGTRSASTARFNWIMTGQITPVANVTTPGSFNEIYRSIGIDALSSAFSSNSQVRTAMTRWLEINANPTSNDCSVKQQLVITISNPQTGEGQPATIDVIIPEDQFMASFGLRRGDIYRLFGCYNVEPEGVFRGLGEKVLLDAVVRSTAVQQARNRFLADHPEITTILNDIQFYKSRIEEIVRLVDKIRTDWSNENTSDSSAQASLDRIRSALGTLESTVDGVDTSGMNISNLGEAVRRIRQTPGLVDSITGAINDLRSGSSNLRDRANATLVDITSIIHNIDEILSGEDQPEVNSIQVGNLNSSGNGAGNGNGGSINRALLSMLLSKKLSPKDFMIAVGSNMVEESLNLPTNAILYYAKHLDDPGRNRDDGKNAFFRAIGQAQVEETFSMPPFFFQGNYPASNATLTDVKINVARSFRISEAEAGARIMQALHLPGSFSVIESRSIDSMSDLLSAARSLDQQLSLAEGTTATFLNGKSIDTANLGNSEVRMLAGKMELPENLINTYLRVRNGTQSLEDAMAESYSITFNSHNEFAARPAQNQTGSTNLSDQCPVRFTLNNGRISSQYVEDNSYVYTDQTGTRSFPSLNEARNYAETVPTEQKVNFEQGIAQALASNPEQAARMREMLDRFLQDPTIPQAFPDLETNLVAYADQNGIPQDTIQEAFQRRDLIDRQGNAKPIGFFLETIGKRTAERRIVSALLGSLSMTFAGLQIDATDIFDILDGNGLQVAYRIGARFVEEELGIDQNLIIRILESPTQVLRNCSLAEIGGGMLGSALGVGTVSLSGNIYKNIGAAKIEQTLGIPAESFRGTNVDELISNVGAAKFAAAFGIPASVAAPPNVVTGLFGSSETGYLQMPMDDQLSELERVMAYPDYVPGSASDLRSIDSNIEQNVKSFLRREGIWNPVQNPGAGTYEYQLNAFQQRVSSIDYRLSIAPGKTKLLLSGTISPDSYLNEVSSETLITNSDNILNALGLGEYREFVVKGTALYRVIDTTLNDLKTCSSAGSTACSAARVRIFQNLQVLLGVNFDAKLGLPDGTLAMIIADPQRAAYEMAHSALIRLDRSLGLVDEQGQPRVNASFSAAFNVWWRNDYKNCDQDPQNCLTTQQNDNILVINGITFNTENRWEVIIRNIGNDLIGDWLNDVGILPVELRDRQTTGPYAGYPSTRELMRNSVNLLLHGDLRILEIAAAVHALRALHFYQDGDNDQNIPAYFRISFEDVYYAIMGNPIMEQRYADIATQNFLYNYSTGRSTAPDFSNNAEMDSGVLPIYASQCYPGMPASNSCVNAQVLTSAYNFYTNSESFVTGPNNATVGTAADPSATLSQVMMSPNASHELYAAQESARNQARSDNRNNLLWRMADAQLYQLDPNIPVGFARTMYQGTGRQRTMMLLLYAANAVNLSEIEIGGVSVGDIATILPIIQEVRNFVRDPNSFNLDAFVSSGHMATVDNWLSDKFSDFLGFDLQPGTFTAIFYGFKKGDFTFDTFRVNGTEIKSLTTIYTDWAINKITGWADKALGLPAGTTFTAYKMYRGLQSARTAIASANAALTAARDAYTIAVGEAQVLKAAGHADEAQAVLDEASANVTTAEGGVTNASGRLTELKAELISFIITTIFAKQIAAVEQALGLVPGTGAILVSAAISYWMTGAVPWVGIAMFVVMNLFGYYKTEVWCTADGYYPEMQSPPSASVYDNGGLGKFNGMNNDARKDGYIEAARYKVRTVIGDALMLPERTGDETAIPSQIMTGRQEDVDYWNYKIDQQICSLIGGCAGTRAGAWQNPQTTGVIHIGY